MARIWFSICGDGNGHALRSSVVLDHLKDHHEILITAPLKAFDYLQGKYSNLVKIDGFAFEYSNNRIDMRRTYDKFTKRFFRYQSDNMKRLQKKLLEFKPEIIISDFEPFSHWLSYGLPIINIDNISLLSRTNVKVQLKYKKNFTIARSFIRWYFGDVLTVSDQKYYLIPTYTFPKPKKNTQLFYPILREDVLRQKPSKKQHVLVYQTTDTNVNLLQMLKKFPEQQFIVYGFNKSFEDKNVTLKPFSKTEFLSDLSSAKAVIVNGGHNVISEALYFGKPVLAVPIGEQFEQIFNGISLQQESFGSFSMALDEDSLEKFLYLIPYYQKRIHAKLPKWDNKPFFEALEKMITSKKMDKNPVFFYPEKYERSKNAILNQSKKYVGIVDSLARRFFKRNRKVITKS